MSKITLDNLSDNLKEYLNGLGLTSEQVNELINNVNGDLNDLYTTNKSSLVGAINELFQNANNGKELIANAIGEPLSSEDTFSAMSNDINGLLSTFKTNMMNNGVTVEASDKFKSLIDKIATMVEEGSGKGIQFTEGYLEPSNLIDKTYAWLRSTDGSGGTGPMACFDASKLGFNPSIVLINFKHKGSVADAIYDNIIRKEYYIQYYSGRLGYDNTLQRGMNVPDVMSSTPLMLPIAIRDEITNIAPISDIQYIAIGVGEEDTTLRDSLADILENKGIDVTEEDDIADLITKVDSIKMGDCTNQDLINVLNNVGYKETKNLTLVSLTSDNVNMDTSYYSIHTLWGNGRTYPLAILNGYDNYTLGTFKPRINFSKYNKIKLRAASNSGYQTGNILMMSNYVASTGTSSSTSATYRTTVKLAPTDTTYEIDISSWAGEGYLAIEMPPYGDGTYWAFMIDSLELIANDNGLNGNETTEQLLSKLNTLSQPPKLTSGTTVTLDNPCLVVGTSGTYYHTYTHKAPSGTILFTVYIDQYRYTTNATVVHKRNDVTLSTTKFEMVEEYNSSSGYSEVVTQYKDYDVQTGDIIEFTFVKGQGSGDRIDIAMLSADIEW